MQFELYFLGAGKPATGSKPAALKHISSNTKAMDWQLNSFSDVTDSKNIHFLGGSTSSEIKNISRMAEF